MERNWQLYLRKLRSLLLWNENNRRNEVDLNLDKNIDKSVISYYSTNDRIISTRVQGRLTNLTIVQIHEKKLQKYWVDAKVSAEFLKSAFKRCSATMDAWFSCIWYRYCLILK